MANFAALANAPAGCTTLVKADACSSVIAASKGPTGDTPADTLAVAKSIVRFPWYQPERIFALLDQFAQSATNEFERQHPGTWRERQVWQVRRRPHHFDAFRVRIDRPACSPSGVLPPRRANGLSAQSPRPTASRGAAGDAWRCG